MTPDTLFLDIETTGLNPFKNPVPMLVMNIQDLKTDIIFICKEDREWIRNNPDGAEAILRRKLFQ